MLRGSTNERFTLFGRRFGSNDVRIASIHTDSTANGADVINNTAIGSADSTTIAVRALKFNGNTSEFFVNGTMTSSATNSDYNNSTTYNRTEPIFIGAEGSASSPDHTVLNGSIQEIMIFNSSLTEAAILAISNYLNHKYNIY